MNGIMGKSTKDFDAREFLSDIEFSEEDYYNQRDNVLGILLNASDHSASISNKYNKIQNSYQIIHLDSESEGFIKNIVYHTARKGYDIHIRDDIKSNKNNHKIRNAVNLMLRLGRFSQEHVVAFRGSCGTTIEEVKEILGNFQPDVFVISFMDGESHSEILDTLHKVNKKNNSITFIVLVN